MIGYFFPIVFFSVHKLTEQKKTDTRITTRIKYTDTETNTDSDTQRHTHSAIQRQKHTIKPSQKGRQKEIQGKRKERNKDTDPRQRKTHTQFLTKIDTFTQRNTEINKEIWFTNLFNRELFSIILHLIE